MSHTRTIAYDATFMILYIGFTAAMVTLSATLVAFVALDVEFGPALAVAAIVNVLGWSVLPFAPRLYRQLVGQRFSWHRNGAFDTEAA